MIGETEYINKDHGTYEIKHTVKGWEVTYSPEDKRQYLLIAVQKSKRKAIRMALVHSNQIENDKG